MVDVLTCLKRAGFTRVIVLDGAECGENRESSVILAMYPYEAAKEAAGDGVQLHPYYPVSQAAYEAASAAAKAYAAQGVCLRDDILLKPIFARLPGFTQGRNTLSYADETGSRFHTQTLTIMPKIEPTHHLDAEPHELHCGTCHQCEAACPTNALADGLFHRERCIRHWQLSGKPVPEALRPYMGRSLLGCDLCQKACPHNPAAEREPITPVTLEELLTRPKEVALCLRPVIGANLAIPNRLLSQGCLMAGCSGRTELVALLEPLTSHPSPTVSEHARWALRMLGK